MKATGIVRRIDDLGRVVIPKKIRRNLKIREGDLLEIFIEDGAVCFKKYSLLREMGERMNDLCEAGYNILSDEVENISIYDRCGQVAAGGKALCILPKDVPDGWEENYTDIQAGSIYLYPLINDGELVGHIHVQLANRSKPIAENVRQTIKLLAQLAQKEIEV